MRPSILTLATLVAGLLHTAFLQAASTPFMAPDDLSRGMRGMGKTVFQGTTIDTFEVEILGVQRHRLGPGQDLILARLSGGPLEETGVIRGMSGSPVYIDGRLIGAVAYGWPYSKVPICGITPIHEMIQVMDRSLEPPPESGKVWTPPAVDLEGTARLKDIVGDLRTTGPITLEPLGTPVWITGFTPAAGKILQDLLGPLGLHPVATPGGEAPADALVRLEPGAALGVQLIAGDLSATGIGTLTYMDGERIIGFGHPMMLTGATDMPMTGAYIHDIIPSRFFSFKLGAATAPVGAVRQDRATAIAGLVGPVPAMLPIEVQVRSAAGAETFHFQVLRHQNLTPGLTRTVLLGALESAEKLLGAATLHLRAAIRLGRTVQREQVYSGPAAILTAALEATRPLDALSRTRFSGIHLDGLSFSVELTENIETAQVRGLRVENRVLRPGETLALQVTLQPYRQPPVEQEVEIALPAEISSGPLFLRAGSGAAGEGWEGERRPDAFQPRTAQHLLEVLDYHERNDELIVELYRQEESLTVDGRELPGLPPSARFILEQGNSSGRLGPVHGRVIQRQRVRTDYVLSGEQSLELMVRKP